MSFQGEGEIYTSSVSVNKILSIIENMRQNNESIVAETPVVVEQKLFNMCFFRCFSHLISLHIQGRQRRGSFHLRTST
jgi:hypothetical protein